MNIACIWEHNGDDTLLYARDFPGAYSRGNNLETASAKLAGEIRSYCAWIGQTTPVISHTEIVLDVPSSLDISDADSDVLLPGEDTPMSMEEYLRLKRLALRSAVDFYQLYLSIPDKTRRITPLRRTFYGQIPSTAEEMYLHTKSVNEYYFGEIGVDVDNEGTILECRERGFAALEKFPGFLDNQVIEGNYGELWSVKKVLRRFVWHDRIHAKAMYRRSIAVFGSGSIADVFLFDAE